MVTMFALSIIWGERRVWVAAVLAIVTTSMIFFSFDLVLEVRFPARPLHRLVLRVGQGHVRGSNQRNVLRLR